MTTELQMRPSHDLSYIEAYIYSGGNLVEKERFQINSGNKIIYEKLLEKLMKHNLSIAPTDLNALSYSVKVLKGTARNFSSNFKINMEFSRR